MKQSTKKLIIAICFSLFVVGISWLYDQWLMCALGVVTGILRIVFFWSSEESKSFEQHEIKLPKAQRKAESQKALEADYVDYEVISRSKEFWKKPLGFAILLIGIALVVYLDKNMIFYTFFMSMLTTWMWFQWWLAWRVAL